MNNYWLNKQLSDDEAQRIEAQHKARCKPTTTAKAYEGIIGYTRNTMTHERAVWLARRMIDELERFNDE